jgi:hypothetical protein
VLALAGRDHLEQGAQSLGDAAVATDDLAHVRLRDVELDHAPVGLVVELDRHGVRVVHQRLCDVLDQIDCGHGVSPP